MKHKNPHAYLVYQTLNDLSVSQLRQLAKDFKVILKGTKGATKSRMIKTLMHPKSSTVFGGGRRSYEEDDEDADAEEAEDTEEYEDRDKRRRVASAEPSSSSSSSSSSSAPSAPIPNPYQETCGDYGKLEDPAEYASALANGLVPYFDPILQSAIEPDDLVVIQGRCYSKTGMRSWVSSFVDKTVKPTSPLTREILTLEDIQKLDLDPQDFIHTYGPEARGPQDHSTYQLTSDLLSQRVAVVWSPNGHQLASSGNGNGLIIWDFATRQPIKIFGHQINQPTISKIHNIDWQDNILISVGIRSVRLWNPQAANYDPGLSLVGNQDINYIGVKISPNGRYIAVGANTGKIFIWDVSQLSNNLPTLKYILNTPISEFTESGRSYGDEYSNLSWSPNSRYLATVNNNCRGLLVWDIAKKSLIIKLEIACPLPVAWNPGPIINQVLVTGSGDNTELIIWNARTLKPIRTVPLPELGHDSNPVQNIVWSPDGLLLACSTETNNNIGLWRYNVGSTLTHEQTFIGHTAMILNLSWSPEGNWLVSTSRDGEIKIWDTSAF